MVRFLFIAFTGLVLFSSRGTAGSEEHYTENRATGRAISRVDGPIPQIRAEVQDVASPQPTAAKLTWTSGDAIPGQWTGADRDSIRWFADSLFRDSVQIDRRYLSQIDFPTDNGLDAIEDASPGTYLIQWIDGGRMFAEIRHLDATHWTVFSPRFGEVKLRREFVSGVQNLANAGQWAAGRFDLEQWDAARGQKRFWQVNSLGQLRSTRQNIHLFREAELPASSLIEVELSWTKKLDFMFGLGVPRNARETEQLPRLETWDDSLVFSYGDNFEIVMESFANPQNRLRLLVHWDQAKQKVAIHDASGKLLCAADLSGLKSQNKKGIYLENKAGDLTVSELRIRQSEPGFDSTKPSFQLVNQPAVNGQIQAFDGANWSVQTLGENENVAGNIVLIPHAEFSNAFSLSPNATEVTTDVTQIEFYDGTLVSGELQDYAGQTLRLMSKAAQQPLELKIAGVRQVRFPKTSPPQDDQAFTHQMFNLVGAMRGRLEPGSQVDGDVLQWRLPGASQSIPFASAHAKIVLQKRRLAKEPTKQWPDTLYFYNRDRIPCRVLGIADQVVRFESFTERSQVDSSVLKAIDLESAFLNAAITPQDVNWIIPEKSRDLVVAKDSELHVSESATFSHANLMRTGGFEFQMNWKASTYGILEVDLFGDTRLDRAGRVKLQFYFYDTSVMVSSQNSGNQQNSPTPNHKATIRVQLKDRNVQVSINNRTILTEALPNEAMNGTGVKFSVNKVTEEKFIGRISNVQHMVSDERGETTIIADEQKELLLTIPRIRKNNPPQHVLRAANGDMVRGELVSMDQESIQFKANHEALKFPRRVVSSLIWLHFKPDDAGLEEVGLEEVGIENSEESREELPIGQEASVTATNTAPATNSLANDTLQARQTVQVLISGDRRLTYDLNAWRDQLLVGRSDALGDCSIPLAEIEELRFGSFANQALDVPYSDWVARLAPEPQLMTGSDGDQRSDLLFGTRSPLIGSELPDLKLTTLEGEMIELKSLVGKVVVLDFWATWCSPCVRAMPDLIAATGEFSSDDVVLIAVNQEEDAGTINDFLAGRGWKLQVGMDNGTIARRLQVQSLPQTIVIAPNGKIAFVKVGYSSDLRHSLKRAISSFLDNE
jgi:thiol-disulfide isomerase/thioredoxin